MKARTPPVTFKQIQSAVTDEFERQHDEMFAQMAPKIMAQTLATVLWTMHTRYGWGKRRLRGLVEALHDTDELMDNPSPLHHRFDPLDCERQIQEQFGIDLRREFEAKVEVRK